MPSYHFFNPLLAPNQAWAAFEWQTFPVTRTDLGILSATVKTCLPLARQHPLWVPCATDWLDQGEFHDFVGELGSDRAILVFPGKATDIKEHDGVCQQLRREGAGVAVEIADRDILKKLAGTRFDRLVFDADHARHEIPLIDLINANQHGYQLAATGVHSYELFEWAVAKRFTLLSSHFVATVDPAAPVEADTTRLKLLKLLSLVVQDAETREIEEIFRQEPKLSYNLLRLVNSVAVGPKTPITGFNQAITVLGRRQLQRWLQLLIYANQFSQAGRPNPLLQLAAARGRQMELLVNTLPTIADVEECGEAAFMTGIFSLLDTLLHLPMAEVLAALPLAPPIAAALSERSGPLGRLLAAVVAGNDGEYPLAAEILATLGIDPHAHLAAQIDAYTWASRIALE